jgi:hypothetical protein
MPFIILIKLKFSNLATLAFDNDTFVMILGYLQINFVVTSVLLVFKKGSSKFFSIQLMQKVAFFCGITH